jgi:3'(2'), 5'-bisphosphate nucleotidase
VNIALVEDGVPVRGVVYAPAKGRLFYTTAPAGAWRKPALRPETVGEASPIGVRTPDNGRAIRRRLEIAPRRGDG